MRHRNIPTAVTLDDLATLRWNCGSCEEWDTGAGLNFSYDHHTFHGHCRLELRKAAATKIL